LFGAQTARQRNADKKGNSHFHNGRYESKTGVFYDVFGYAQSLVQDLLFMI